MADGRRFPKRVSILPNSQNGRKLQLKGKGLSTAKTEGDQIVTLKVVLPEAHTREQQERLKLSKL